MSAVETIRPDSRAADQRNPRSTSNRQNLLRRKIILTLIVPIYLIVPVTVYALGPALLGRTGFALIPFRNLLLLASVVAVAVGLAIAAGSKFKILPQRRPFGNLFVLFPLLMAALGLAGLPFQAERSFYIVSDAVYLVSYFFLSAFGAALIEADPAGTPGKLRVMLISSSALGLITALLALPLDPSVILISLAFTFAASGVTAAIGLASTALLVLSSLGSMNRGSILAFVSLIMITGSRITNAPKIFSVIAIAIMCGLIITQFYDLSSSSAGRRYNETAALLDGTASLDDQVALAQRIYETNTAMATLSNLGVIGWVFGAGIGATIDMSQSLDASVRSAAALGESQVHNLHFLIATLTYRHGVFGVIYFILLTGVALRAAWLLRRRTTVGNGDAHLLLYACASYVVAMFVYAQFASNQLLSDPLFFVSAGVVSNPRPRQRGAGGASGEFGRS